ncbi:hypothetical protein EHQ42_02130 [Leptospira levettii]|uniref:hypothetical protein n=1 Tax=Leptospira levettii TaxID=2023178 RepID=UPI001084250B|nr:hypothetical protein [Leptospira levettii]TGL25342.1 hypothetical protein EHQ42_02130 [Leptospira levettii]
MEEEKRLERKIINVYPRMNRFYILFFVSFFNSCFLFDLEVKKEVGGTDYILAEISCSRYGYRLPIIEEILWADTFGGLKEIRSRMNHLERYAILSSSREGRLDFHLGYLLLTKDTYIFKNTIPVGYGFCVPNKKTVPYYYSIFSNFLLEYFSSNLNEIKFFYLGKGTYKQAGLWCAKVSHQNTRSLISESDTESFKNSSLFKTISNFGIDSFWLLDNTDDIFFHQVYYGDSHKIVIEEDLNQEKGIICVSSM